MAPNAQGRSDPLQELADSLRARGGVEWRVGVSGGHRVEFSRGKDFARYFRENPERLAPHAHQNKQGSVGVEEQIVEVMMRMLRRGLLVRSARFYKRPKPGKKRLVKFPRKLLMYPRNAQTWDEESFFCWTYDRPTPLYMYWGSALLLLGIIACCLFPLAPYPVRLGVLYISLALLTLIIATISLRALLFGTVWVVTGYEFWLFPNLLSEQVGIDQALWPLVSFEKPSDGKSHLLSRVVALLLAASTVYVLLRLSPKQDLRASAKAASESIFDLMDHMATPGQLSSGNETADRQAGRQSGYYATAGPGAFGAGFASGQAGSQPFGGSAYAQAHARRRQRQQAGREEEPPPEMQPPPFEAAEEEAGDAAHDAGEL